MLANSDVINTEDSEEAMEEKEFFETKCLIVDNTVQLNQEIMLTNREMTVIEPEQPEVSIQPEPEISFQAEPEVDIIPPEPMETDEAQPGQIPDSIIASPVRAR